MKSTLRVALLPALLGAGLSADICADTRLAQFGRVRRGIEAERATLETVGERIGTPPGESYDIDFNSGEDSMGLSAGELVFRFLDGFAVMLTDDQSIGTQGGQADGVHIPNKKYGNSKTGCADLVLGANNGQRAGRQWHSSGIVAYFSRGASRVSLLDTGGDGTLKTLFAFGEDGALIGQSTPGSGATFSVDTSDTGGALIYSVEFDTLPGTAGGASDGTYFTVDDLHVETPATALPAPAGSYDIDFNSQVDSSGKGSGELVFRFPDGFAVTFTDDQSSGSQGGQADGAHITKKKYGSSNAGSSDYVLGANNGQVEGAEWHSSGIVAHLSHGARLVSLLDTVDVGTQKTLFAYGKDGALIGQSPPGSRATFSVDTSDTGGALIYSVEFDTESGTAGGSSDGTFFTVDDFHVEMPTLAPTAAPTPAPTSSPTSDASAVDDPHLTSLAGERFSIGAPSFYTFLRVPKSEQQPAMLHIRGNVTEEPFMPCKLYIVSIEISGELLQGSVVQVLPLARDKPGSNAAGSVTKRPFSLELRRAGAVTSTSWEQAAREWVTEHALSPRVAVRPVGRDELKSLKEGQAFDFVVNSSAHITVHQASHQALNIKVSGTGGLGMSEIGGLLGTEKHSATIEQPTDSCRAFRSRKDASLL